MFALMSPLLWRILAVAAGLAAIGAAVLGYGHSRYNLGVKTTTDRYEQALSKQKTEAAQLLAEATGRVLVFERKLAAERAAQEVKDADNKTKVAALSAQLRAAAGTAGRLRDPNQVGGCGAGGGGATAPAAAASSPGGDDRAQAGGLLSEPLSRLLLRITREADEVNLAYIACRTDAYSVRQ